VTRIFAHHNRRTKLDPAGFGYSSTRRRTPGLRREEVAQRANVSATWYTWLEQGRGGPPSAGVLERIARALMLTDVEREHLFLLGLGRPPEVRYQPTEGVTPRLQRVLDSFELSPAYVKTSTWDIIAWNRAASVVLVDYGALVPDQRNILRLLFCNPQVAAAMPNWKADAGFVVAAFRADVARSGAAEKVAGLVAELCRISPDFEAMWRDHDVRATYGEGAKQVRHKVAGLIGLEYSSFAVDGRPDLSMVVYNPATPADADLIRPLLKSQKPVPAFLPSGAAAKHARRRR
jgi:transcriptional regulator with XRE-family HTH domain